MGPSQRDDGAQGAGRWPAALFFACCVASLGTVALAWIHPSVGVPGGARPAAMFADGPDYPAAARAAQEARLPGARLPRAVGAGATPATSRAQDDTGESEWQRARADALRVQRMNDEMRPLTPGVTEDQYMGGDDTVDAAPAAVATQSDDE